jgi:type IV fimbrial biogenesis protein FimT
MPSYSNILRNSEIRSATHSIAYGLRVARNEAIRRNAVVTFSLAADGGGLGWAIKQASDDSVIQSSSAQEIGAHIKVVAEPTEAVSVAFSPFGMAMPDAADAATIRQLAIASTTPEDAHTLKINIDGNYIRVCDPSPLLLRPDPRAC